MVAATVFHSKTATAPDDPAYNIVPSDWNSGHAVSAMLQQADFANSNGVTFGVAAGVVTASVSVAGGAGSVQFSAGSLSQQRTDITFANSNGVSFGLNTNGVITGSVAAAGGAQTAISGIAAAGGTATSGTVSFANSNGVSFGMNGQSMTATVKTDYQTSGAYLTTAALSQDSSKYPGTGTSATNATVTLNSNGLAISVAPPGAATNAVGINTANTNVTWTVNTSGISLNAAGYAGTGFSGTNATATLGSNGLQLSVGAGGAGALQSYWNNNVVYTSLIGTALASNTSYVFPIQIPYPLSIGYLRIPMQMPALTSTTIATAALTSFTNQSNIGIFAVIYSLGTGANSQSLQYVTSGSAGMIYSLVASMVASQWSWQQSLTYFANGTFSNTSFSVAASTSNFSVNTTQMTAFTGTRAVDIPINGSIPAGAYWVALGQTTAQTTGYSSDLAKVVMPISQFFLAQQSAGPILAVGVSGGSSNPVWLGLGVISLAAQGTSSSLNMQNINSSAQRPLPPIQFINQA